MAFEIGWLKSARKELDAEIEYVYSEFGEDSARRHWTNLQRVWQMPQGMDCSKKR